MQTQTSFTVKDPQGQSHQISGDPQRLTLADTLSQISGKTGGEQWDSEKVQFRIGKMSYSASERRSLSELGVQPGTTIEVLGS